MKKDHMNMDVAAMIGTAIEHGRGMGMTQPRDLGLIVLSDLDKQGFKISKKAEKKPAPQAPAPDQQQ